VEEKKSSLRNAVDTIKMNTRHYAKRQITWLRHQISGHEFAMDKPDYGSVEKMIRHYLSAPDDKSSPGATAQ
jgi:tRNA A37 N6-isopentenylltransferase MiaA